MPDFPGETVRAIDQFAVGDNAASEPGPQGYDNEILHAAGGAKKHFPQGRGICIIGHGGWDAEKACQFRPDVDKFPSKIGWMLDRAFMIVGVGSSDSDAGQFMFCLQSANQEIGVPVQP